MQLLKRAPEVTFKFRTPEVILPPWWGLPAFMIFNLVLPVATYLGEFCWKGKGLFILCIETYFVIFIACFVWISDKHHGVYSVRRSSDGKIVSVRYRKGGGRLLFAPLIWWRGETIVPLADKVEVIFSSPSGIRYLCRLEYTNEKCSSDAQLYEWVFTKAIQCQDHPNWFYRWTSQEVEEEMVVCAHFRLVRCEQLLW